MSIAATEITRIRGTDGDSLSLSVQKYICDSITSGELRPGDKLEAPEKLAETWGVSAGTLRHALQSLAARGVVVRRPRLGTYINPDLSQSALLLGTGGGETARPMAERSDLLAMIVPDLRVYEFAAVARGVESAAESANLRLMVGNSENKTQRLNQLVRDHIEAGVAGLIIACGTDSRIDFDLIVSLQQRNIPVVLAYRSIGLVDWPVVRTDGYYNTALLVEHLASIGRKHIGYYDYGDICSSETFFKLDGQAGFFSTMARMGLPADLNLHLEFPWSDGEPASGFNPIRQEEVDRVKVWLKDRPHIDAILCVCDRLAALVVNAAQQLGRRVPEDIAVTGFGHHGHLFGLKHRWLTSVNVKFEEIGQRMCDLILDMRNGTPATPRLRVALPGTLCVGQSTVPG